MQAGYLSAYDNEGEPGSNNYDNMSNYSRSNARGLREMTSHLFPAPSTPSKGPKTPYLSPSFGTRFSPRYGESDTDEQNIGLSATLETSAPPSQSLYDIVKPLPDEQLVDGDSKGRSPLREAAVDGYQESAEWERRADGENWNYGDIVRHYVPPGQCNWINIQYQTRLQAKKAVSKNGKIIGDNLNLMVGVVECYDKAWLQAGEIGGATNIGFPRTLNPTAQRQVPRPYKVDIFDAKRPPSVNNSVWAKFMEYVLGA